MAKIVKPNVSHLNIKNIKKNFEAKREKTEVKLQNLDDRIRNRFQEIGVKIKQSRNTIEEHYGKTVSIFEDLGSNSNVGTTQSVFSNGNQQLSSDWKSPYPYNYMNNTNVVQTQREVYSYLKGDMGLNDAAVAGIMGNIHNESMFNTRSSAMDVNGYKSNGLFCWNEGAYKPWAYGTTVNSQMSFMASTIKPSTLQKLQNVPNTPDGAQQAALIFAKEYEVCSSSSYGKRQTTAVDYYNSFN